MFKVLILVCSVAVAPQDCHSGNAIDVVQGPIAANEVMCGFAGQAYIAGTAFMNGVGQRKYVKIQCIRPQASETAGGASEAGRLLEPDAP
jgi:hypothetical protein